jgi:excisionase family DNA binding protein
MQTNNPFELILSKLELLQTTVDGIADATQKPSPKSAIGTERLLDLAEAAEIVRRPVGTVRYYIHHRNLPATKIGKGYLIKLGELLAWVEEFHKTTEKTDPMARMRENRKRYKKN